MKRKKERKKEEKELGRERDLQTNKVVGQTDNFHKE